jgi:HEAT repeat protein
LTHRLLRTLLVSLGAWGAGAGTAANVLALSDVPVDVLEEAVERASELDQRSLRRQLLTTLARDERPAVRRRVAQALGRIRGPVDGLWATDLLLTLSADTDWKVRNAAAQGVAERFAALRSEARFQRAQELAQSQKVDHRTCLAQALQRLAPEPEDMLLLEQLCADDNASVRREATRALGARFNAAPKKFGWLLTEMLDDPDKKVAQLARRIAQGTLA